MGTPSEWLLTLQPGARIAVCFDEGIHERLLLRSVGTASTAVWVAATPEWDLVEEDLGAASSVHLIGPRGGLPAALRQAVAQGAEFPRFDVRELAARRLELFRHAGELLAVGEVDIEDAAMPEEDVALPVVAEPAAPPGAWALLGGGR